MKSEAEPDRVYTNFWLRVWILVREKIAKSCRSDSIPLDPWPPLPPNMHCNYTLYCCDRKSQVTYAQSFALWQQATIEFTCHDHSPPTPVVAFNRSRVNIGRASTPRSLFYCLFAPNVCMVLFFTHISFVVNHTSNATPPERLQQ